MRLRTIEVKERTEIERKDKRSVVNRRKEEEMK
jgi:hypothetical protein